MTLLAFYPALKITHISLALLSGLLFFMRGLGALHGFAFVMSPPARWTSVAIDTGLLAAAVLLLMALQLNPLTTPWLQAKLGLLVAYIGLGTLALRRASTRSGKAMAYVAALLCYGAMIAIARTHDPVGFLMFAHPTTTP